MTEELSHVRCISCNKVIGHKWNKYQELLSQGVTIKDALTQLGLTRSCCRMRLMSPFKVITRIADESMTNPQMKSSYPELSIATSDEASADNALSMIKAVTSLTIIPEENSDIQLPGLPALPSLPEQMKKKKTTRVYDAR